VYLNEGIGYVTPVESLTKANRQPISDTRR
jgi:hypothetical protein